MDCVVIITFFVKDLTSLCVYFFSGARLMLVIGECEFDTGNNGFDATLLIRGHSNVPPRR